MQREMLLAWLASDNGLVVNVTIFALLVLGGFGLPIPEDLPLIFAGVATSNDIIPLPIAFAVCYTGVIISDQIIFGLGYFFGNRILDAGTRSRYFPAITEERINEIREGLKRKQFIYIFIGRHIYPVRTATFLTAGALRIPYKDFFVADIIAGLVSVSAMMTLGYVLGRTFSTDVIAQIADDIHWYITGIIAACMLAYLLRRVYKKNKKCKMDHSQMVIAPCNCAGEPIAILNNRKIS
ncbi:MAG: DedA family protein [Deltaproteobacteria bacterium]|nr:DedA family protein [Deltaproteobacteria bacterium]